MNINPITSMKIGLGLIIANLKRRKIENYEDYFIRGFGKTGYSIVFEGFANKVWGDPKKLSEELARRRSPASSILDVLKTALVKTDKNVSADFFYYPKNGYGVMCEKLAEQVTKKKGKILLSTVPQKIIVTRGKVSSVEILSGKKKKKIACDVLISTLSINELPKIIYPEVPKEIIDKSDKLKFRSLVIGYVFLNKPKALKDNWIFFPEREFCFNRVAEQKSFSSYTVPEKSTVLTAEITCDYGDKTYNSSDEDIKKIIIADLEKAGLIKKEEVIDFIARRAGRVYPVYSIDYRKNLEPVLEYLDNIDNLYTAGRLGLFNYNNADHCLDMAKVISKIILEGSRSTEWKKAREYFDSYRIVD